MQKQTPGPPLHSDRHLMDALDCEAVRAEDLNSFLGPLVSVFCHPAVPASTMRSCTKLSQASHRLKPLGWWTIYQGFKNSICTNRKFHLPLQAVTEEKIENLAGVSSQLAFFQVCEMGPLNSESPMLPSGRQILLSFSSNCGSCSLKQEGLCDAG